MSRLGSVRVLSPGSVLKCRLLLALAVLGMAGAEGQAARMPKELWVAPDGDDSRVGSKPEPLATLEGARDRIRQLRREAEWPKGGVTVWLRAGTYRRDQAFELTEEDSGAPLAPITYRAERGQTVTLLGGTLIHFEPLQDPAVLSRLGAVARASVQVAHLPSQGVEDFGHLTSRGFGRPVTPAHLELFCQGEPMTLARWPNAGEWLTIADVPESSAADDGHGRKIGDLAAGFDVDTTRPRRWQASTNWWVHGYWAWDWANSYERLAAIDPAAHHLLTAPPHGLYGFRPGQRFYFLNVLEELDTPGEYFCDTATGHLYFWKPFNAPDDETIVSVLSDPIIRVRQASHVTIQGLGVEAGRGHGIHVQGGRRVVVTGCRLRNLGNHGVVLDGGEDHEVLHCDILDTGDGGVMASGGDRQSLKAGGHLIENNHFHRQGRWSKCYVPAIGLAGVGLLARHNLIHDHPHCAVLFSGNDHRIEFNEIHHIALETGDVGAIYSGRDWTFRGNRIVHNYIHDTGGVGMGSMGVYMDDCVSGTTIEGNVFRNVQRAVFLGGGRDHRVENNIFLDCRPAVAVDGRGLDASPVWHNMIYRTMKDRLGDVPADLYRSEYPALVDLDPYYASNKGVPPEHNIIRRNLSFGGEWLTINWHAQEAMIRLDANLADVDPQFRDAGRNDFRLGKRSPARDLGFQPIPFDRIGLYRSDDRRDLERSHGSLNY